MIDELASLCRKLDISQISQSSCEETEFLRRTGFHQTESEWVREVSPQ